MAELGGKKVALGGMSENDGRRSGRGKNVVGGKGGAVETKSAHVRLDQGFIQALAIARRGDVKVYRAPQISKPTVRMPRTGA